MKILSGIARSPKSIALMGAPLLFAAMLVIGPPSVGTMTPQAWHVAALGVWMALWWVTEAVPIAATALLPMALFPLLGVMTIGAATAPYANPVIYLFFGGFILAAAFERSGLHRRLALGLLGVVGTRPDRVVLGFMITGGFLSMWVSNTASVLMLLPLANSMLTRPSEASGSPRASTPATGFERALLLGIAYAATIGGYGTLIGTPPNALLSAFLQQTHGVRLGFLDYMLIGVPIVAVGIPVAWLVLTRLLFRVDSAEQLGHAGSFDEQRRALGPASRQEWFVGIVGTTTALAWMTQPLLARVIPGLSEAGIGILCAVVLLIVPIDARWKRAVEWKEAESIPWGVLVLFGGGLSLANGIQESGLAGWMGETVGGLEAVPPLVLVLVVVTSISLLTELTSNTATAAAFLPIASALAVGAGLNPLVLVTAAGLAASNGFMLPVGTPPNAIVFASGRLSIPQMARAGALLDAVFVVLISGVAYFLAERVLG